MMKASRNGACEFWREGRVNLCHQREVVGVSCGEFRCDDAFAESVVVPERIVHRLPEGLSFEEAAFPRAGRSRSPRRESCG